jgi:hypothetical protein
MAILKAILFTMAVVLEIGFTHTLFTPKNGKKFSKIREQFF